MIIMYQRVSTAEQNLDRQKALEKKYNVETVYSEKISGKNTDRPELKAMLDFIRKGDTLVIESYSRLARNTKDLLTLVELLNEKGVNIISDKENIDTSTPQGKLMFTMFAALAQFERECTLERQKEGIAAAKEKGVYKGRQPIKIDTDLFAAVYTDWRAKKITARAAMEKLNINKDTFYRRVKEYEKNIAAKQMQ